MTKYIYLLLRDNQKIAFPIKEENILTDFKKVVEAFEKSKRKKVLFILNGAAYNPDHIMYITIAEKEENGQGNTDNQEGS